MRVALLPSLAVAGLLALAAVAAADVVYLEGGRRLVGRVLAEGDPVRVEMEGGSLTIPRSRIVRIERAELPADEFTRRRGELAVGDADGALVLARFAREHGLTRERGELLELATEWAPDDESARRELRRWERMERHLPPDPAADARLLGEFGPGAKLHLTQHWRVAHDVSLDVARDRGDMLEAAWRKFHELAERIGIEADPIDERLEVLLFAEHARWLDATGLPPEQVAEMSGIYVARTGRVLLFDPLTAPAARKSSAAARAEVVALDDARAAIDGQRAQLDELMARLERGSHLNREQRENREKALAWVRDSLRSLAGDELEVSRRETQLRTYLRQLRAHFEGEALASVTHEACHQLAFATGIGRAGDPRWLSEGLATLFEVTSRSAFVLEAPNSGRLADVRAAWADGRGGSLANAVSDAHFRAPDGSHGASDGALAYAESWAVAHFLAMRRPAAFARYVRDVEQLPPLTDAPARRLAEFKAHFGDDLPALEREWRRYIDHL